MTAYGTTQNALTHDTHIFYSTNYIAPFRGKASKEQKCRSTKTYILVAVPKSIYNNLWYVIAIGQTAVKHKSPLCT